MKAKKIRLPRTIPDRHRVDWWLVPRVGDVEHRHAIYYHNAPWNKAFPKDTRQGYPPIVRQFVAFDAEGRSTGRSDPAWMRQYLNNERGGHVYATEEAATRAALGQVETRICRAAQEITTLCGAKDRLEAVLLAWEPTNKKSRKL